MNQYRLVAPSRRLMRTRKGNGRDERRLHEANANFRHWLGVLKASKGSQSVHRARRAAERQERAE